MELDVSLAANELRISRSALVLWTGVLVTVGLHLMLSGLYGYQRDELYFIACAHHLALGYVDQPPLIGIVTDLSLKLFGDSLSAIRLLPALAAAGLVALAVRLTERFGGGLYAQLVTMIAVALSPFDFAVGNLLTMNAFEPLFWLGLGLLVYDQLKSPRAWRWPVIGAVIGVGFLNKWSMALYAVALLIGVLLSSARRRFIVPGLAVSIGIAVAIAAPNLVWQAVHGWPQMQVLRNADLAKNQHVGAGMFMLEQLPLMNPLSAPLWIAGLWALLRTRRFAGIAIAYIVLVTIELVLHGKVYYVAPIYPALIAVGAVAFERFTARRRTLRQGLTVALVAAALAIMPLATPALPIPALLDYQRTIDVRSFKIEKHPTGLVPQQFADQLGWDDLVTTISGVVDTLSPSERASAAVLTNDYGQAAAIDFLGRRDGLPFAISGHNQYYLWGPHGEHAAVIAIGVPYTLLAREYRSIVRATTYVSPYVLPENNHLPVYVCRDARIPLVKFWPNFRRYI